MVVMNEYVPAMDPRVVLLSATVSTRGRPMTRRSMSRSSRNSHTNALPEFLLDLLLRSIVFDLQTGFLI